MVNPLRALVKLPCTELSHLPPLARTSQLSASTNTATLQTDWRNLLATLPLLRLTPPPSTTLGHRGTLHPRLVGTKCYTSYRDKLLVPAFAPEPLPRLPSPLRAPHEQLPAWVAL